MEQRGAARILGVVHREPNVYPEHLPERDRDVPVQRRCRTPPVRQGVRPGHPRRLRVLARGALRGAGVWPDVLARLGAGTPQLFGSWSDPASGQTFLALDTSQDHGSIGAAGAARRRSAMAWGTPPDGAADRGRASERAPVRRDVLPGLVCAGARQPSSPATRGPLGGPPRAAVRRRAGPEVADLGASLHPWRALPGERDRRRRRGSASWTGSRRRSDRV